MGSKVSRTQVKELYGSQLSSNAEIITPDDGRYEECIKKWSDFGLKHPGVVIRPKNAEGIADTIEHARKHKVDIAVKCGGHATDTSNTNDGGILIDLSRMRQVTVDPHAHTITVQGGAVWADVNETADQHKLSTISGSHSQVGVGGLTLRGGYGSLTPQYGLAIDNLLSATVVTGTGQILRSSKDENPDLFWAVRGAGQTVGVVAEFAFQAHSQPNQVWNGTRVYAKEKLPEIIQALNEARVHPAGKALSQCILSLSPETGEPVVITVLFFDGPEEEGKKHFSSMLKVKCLSSDMKMRSYAESNALIDPVAPRGGLKKLVAMQLAPPLRPEFASELMKEISQKLTAEPAMAKTIIQLEFMDLSRMRSVPISETAFPARNQMMNGVIILQWTDESKQRDAEKWGDKIQTMCDDELRRSDLQPDKLVSNFLNFTSDDKASPSDMFGPNADKLLEIKRRYDPDNVFHKMNPLK